MEYFIDSGEQPAFIKYPMVLLFYLYFYLLIAIEITISAVDNIMFQMLD
jgi:cytochrome c oxidase cbb3-type subunit 3